MIQSDNQLLTEYQIESKATPQIHMRILSKDSKKSVLQKYFQFLAVKYQKLEKLNNKLKHPKLAEKNRNLFLKRKENLEHAIIGQEQRFRGDFQLAKEQFLVEKKEEMKKEILERVDFIKKKIQEQFPEMLQYFVCPITYIMDIMTKNYSVSLQFKTPQQEEPFCISYSDEVQKIFSCSSQVDLKKIQQTLTKLE